jgi:hypothetical protein
MGLHGLVTEDNFIFFIFLHHEPFFVASVIPFGNSTRNFVSFYLLTKVPAYILELFHSYTLN